MRALVISSRKICYFSGAFFAARMAEALEKLGVEVTFLEFGISDDLDRILPPLYGKNYDLILDVNTQMGHLMEEDRPVLDCIGGPFFDYVVDHPLFHYNSLHSPASDLHAIAIDRGQKDYIDRYYDNVKSTLFLPLAATEALETKKTTPVPRRILIMSTFEPLDKTYALVEAAPGPIRTYIDHLIELRRTNPNRPIHEAFAEVLKREGREVSDHDFALLLNACYPADTYIRNYFREKTVRTLAEAGIPLTLVGEGWEKFDCPGDLQREKGIPFALSFERMAKEQILLNNAPMFPQGAHDRVFGAMANHCALLTDRNPYLESEFEDGKQLAFYDARDLYTLKETAISMLSDPNWVFDMQKNAYFSYQQSHTWEKRMEKLLNFVKS